MKMKNVNSHKEVKMKFRDENKSSKGSRKSRRNNMSANVIDLST